MSLRRHANLFCINYSACEVAVMAEGAMRHGTTMEVEGNYVDRLGWLGG